MTSADTLTLLTEVSTVEKREERVRGLTKTLSIFNFPSELFIPVKFTFTALTVST